MIDRISKSFSVRFLEFISSEAQGGKASYVISGHVLALEHHLVRRYFWKNAMESTQAPDVFAEILEPFTQHPVSLLERGFNEGNRVHFYFFVEKKPESTTEYIAVWIHFCHKGKGDPFISLKIEFVSDDCVVCKVHKG